MVDGVIVGVTDGVGVGKLIQLQSSNNSSYNSSPDYFTHKAAFNPYQQFEKAKI